MNTRSSLRRLALLAAVALAAPAGHAQEADRPTHEAFAERYLAHVQERLDLDARQTAIVEQAFAQREPGALWAAAAALAPTLSDEQRARLTAPPERTTEADRPHRTRPEGARRDRAAREERGGREADQERRERPDRSGHFEAVKAARNAALGLSAEQAAALDRVEAQQREAWQERRAQRNADGAATGAERAERPARAPIPEGVAEILDDEQETIWLVHRALAHGRRGPGPSRH